MALPPSLDPGPRSEPLNHPPGAPRELDIAECTICPSEEERIRPEQAQTPGQDSLCPSEHLQGGLKNTEPTSGHPRLPTPYSHEDSTGGKHRESPLSGWEVLEAEQDHLHLCLLGLGRRLQDLEQGLGSWTLAQNGMVQLQTLQADLRGTAECVDALLTFSEGLAQRSEPQAWASLQQVLRALGAHRDSIFWRLWRLQAQLVSYSLDIFMLGLSHQKHLVGHQRLSLLQKSQDKKTQASSSLQDVMLEVDPGALTTASRRPLTFLLLFLLLVGFTLLLSQSGGPCCSPAPLARTPYLVLNYVNGLPPI
uniref:Spectrin repeat containing nuclear envelope family member 4 n=1 Tax=Pipistrellus kuhlii TaxID=59472 RepID=A0A7J7V1K6_PIPKU|nr:spectrin repeat containing nuclear envelope family member 4 [Pipistrellus kuhlii]